MSDAPTPKKFSVRGFTSLLLTLAFLAMSFSGIILYVTPKGQTAHWTGWTMLGLGKEDWAGLHMNVAFLFLIVALVHLVLNWTRFWGYLKKRATAGIHLKRELAGAAAIAAVVIAGTLYHVPPLGSIVDANDAIKRYWMRHAAQAPIPHAEQLSLEAFAAEVDLPLADVTEALKQEGFNVDDTTITIRQLAEQKDVNPSAVFAAIQARFPEAGQRPGRGQGPGLGQGRGQGRGQGEGMGRGQGRGPGGGQGMGRGQGPGRWHDESDDE